MRSGLLLLFLSCVLLAASIVPPFDNVSTNNNALLPGLESRYLATLPLGTPTIEDPFSAAGARLLQVMPAVDNRISADSSNDLWWVWAAQYPGSVHGLTSDSCPEEVQLTFLSDVRYGNATFLFRNNTAAIPLETNLSSFRQATPFSSDILNQTNGTDPLQIDLYATIALTYEFKYLNLYEPVTVNGSTRCESLTPPPPFNSTYHRSFISHLNYTVESGAPDYLPVRPALREQWYRNNRFDVLVGTRRQLYRAEVLLDGVLYGNTALRAFNTRTDALGLQYIHSVNESSSENLSLEFHNSSFLSQPLFGSGPRGYSYLSSIRYPGLGTHVLDLRLYDDFGGSYSHKETLVSRALAYNNISEEAIADPALRRPSTTFPEDQPAFYPLSLGGILLALVLIRLRR